MQRKAKYRINVTRREMLYVGDTPDHTLMLTEMEGEAIEYEAGVAGKFLNRRSVGYHDRTKGAGPMVGYACTTFEGGSVYSRYEGQRDEATKLTSGTWTAYQGTGKLATIKGKGTFTVKPGDKHDEFILEMVGEYEL